MNTIIKSLAFIALISSAIILMTGCNTVKGAFQGAGQDTKAVVHGLQLENPPQHHSTTVTTTRTTQTTAVSPTAVQSTPNVVQPQ